MQTHCAKQFLEAEAAEVWFNFSSSLVVLPLVLLCHTWSRGLAFVDLVCDSAEMRPTS
jgi:hypothetical protein